jgi:hypothetical protein
VKRVHVRRVADLWWQLAGLSGPVAGPLLTERARVGGGEAWPVGPLQESGPWPVEKRKRLFIFEIFFKFHKPFEFKLILNFERLLLAK